MWRARTVDCNDSIPGWTDFFIKCYQWLKRADLFLEKLKEEIKSKQSTPYPLFPKLCLFLIRLGGSSSEAKVNIPLKQLEQLHYLTNNKWELANLSQRSAKGTRWGDKPPTLDAAYPAQPALGGNVVSLYPAKADFLHSSPLSFTYPLNIPFSLLLTLVSLLSTHLISSYPQTWHHFNASK
jgi:hypothetical protein